MRLIWDVNIRKPIALCLIILTILSLTGNSRTVLYAQDEEALVITTLLNNVKSSKYRFSDSEGNSGEIGFETLGEETVSGEATWKVEWEIAEEGGEPETIIMWISKSTGQCLQIEIEGETYTGDMAEMYGGLVLLVWFVWVGMWTEAWNFTTIYGYGETGYGTLSFLGTETRSFGPEQLLVYKYRWEGYATAPEEYFRGVAEYWFAPVSFGTIIVRLYVESDGEWWRTELLSIDLVSPQPRPNIVIDPRIDKTQLVPNEEATVSITTSNTGNAMGTHNLTITVGGEVKKSWLVVLNPGETRSFSHKLSFATTGSYTVRVGDRTFTITVSTTLPARFDVSGLNINPSSIKVGQSSTISVTVKNTGGESGSYTVTLKVNNQAVDTRTGTLSPDQSETVSFTYTPTSEGTYSIDVNGLTGSLTVSKEAGPGPTPEIPWLIIIIVVVAVAVVIIAVIFLRRKPAPPPTYAPPTAPPPPPPPQ
ncbi:MAG: CARDB domain-containing protein [Thermoproteota archaeon]